jgi:hypothetical protein
MDLPDNILLDVKKAMEMGNKKKLNSLLGCQLRAKTRASLDSSLESSTDRASALFRLFVNSLKHPSLRQPLSIEQTLRALLMVSPLYETPFEAAHEFLLNISSLELTIVCTCVSAMEQFLRETRNVWQLKSNPQSTERDGSRAWLEKLTQTTVGIIYGSDSGVPDTLQNDKEGKAILHVFYGVLQTIIALTRALDSRCFESVLEKAFFTNLRPSKIIPLLRLTLASIPLLRVNDIERIRQSLLEDLSRHHPVTVSLSEIPAIVGLSINLTESCIQTFSIDVISKEKAMMKWKEVSFRALSIIAMDAVLYASAEEQIRQALSRMDLRTLQFWSRGLKPPSSDSSVVKHWIRFNLATLSLQALHSTGASIALMALGGSVKRSAHEDDIIMDCCESVLSASYPRDDDDDDDLGLYGDAKIMQALDGVSYGGKGSFVDQNGHGIKILSDIGWVLYNSIHLEQSLSQQLKTGASKRAFRLIEVANQIIEQKGSEICVRTALFAFVAMTIVYLETPSCRDSLVQTIQEYLYAASTTSNTFSSICDIGYAAVNTIVCSVLQMDDDEMSDEGNEKFTSLDPLCGLLSDSVPSHVFSRLVGLEMSSIPRARELILNTSKHLTDTVYTSVCHGDEESMPSSQADGMRAGLLGLLELVRRSRWDTVELEAWKHFSNALVFDMPPLSFSDRSWLYVQVGDLIENEEVSKAASFHLLRATIARLSYFFEEVSEHGETHFILERAFVLWPDPNSPHHLRAKQLEDTLGLNRLVLSLLYYASTFYEGNSDMMLHFARGREALLHSVLTKSQKSLRTKSNAIKEFFEEICPDGKYSDDLKLCLSASICQFASILDSLVARLGQTRKTGRGLGKDSFPSMGHLLQEILSREGEELRSYSPNGRADKKLPVWLVAQGLPCGIFKGRLSVEQPILLPLKASMFDFAIDLLFTPTLPLRGLQNAMLLSRRVILAAGQLVQSKKAVAKSGAEESLLIPETVNKTAAQFFAASSVVIQNIVTQQCTLAEADELVAPILQYCQSVTQLSTESLVIPSPQLLASVWSLYQVIGGERAAVRFIAYLEGKVSSESQSKSENDSSIYSLLSIHTVEDVDDSIQKIRLHVIGALQSCLLTLSSRNQNQRENTNLITSGLTDLHASVSSDFLVNILSALSTDLRTGLDGKSGGITRRLYLAYMAAIEECAISLYTMRDVAGCSSTISCFMEVSEVLSDVMSTFFLDDAVLFRTTFLIATAALPSMCREIVRRIFVLDCQDHLTGLSRVFSMDKILVSGTLSDSMTILSRWSALRDPNSMPWSDIAGSFHLESPDDDGQDKNSISEENMDAEREIPRIVHIPRQSDGNVDLMPDASRKIRFKTRETWSWALSCSLLALDEKWQESVRVLGNSDLRDSGVSVEVSDWCFDFYRERKNELLFSLQSTCKFFASTTTEAQLGNAGQHLILEMFAMNLPSAPRLRFCCLLLNVVKALNYAIDTVHSKLHSACEGAPSATHHVGFIEAACCLSAWLCADFQETDVTVGICRWQSILKRKLPQESSSSGKNAAKDLLARLANLVSLVARLQTKLQKLNRLLQETNASIHVFDILFSGGISEMSSLIAKKLALMKKEVPVDKRLNLLPDFPESSDDTHQKKKRARQEYKTRRKKPPVTTSRNRVVDMFFHLDEGVAEGEGGKGDAFVDLEDFLVEG